LFAVQEIKWLGRCIIGKNCRIYYNCDIENIFGAGFIVSKHIRSRVIFFKPIDMRLWMLRIRGEFKNYSFICAHVPTEVKNETQGSACETKGDLHAVPFI
jgi:hypothetical protein